MFRYNPTTDSVTTPEERAEAWGVSGSVQPIRPAADAPRTIAQIRPKSQRELGAEVHHDAVLFVRGIINEAIVSGASDIHIEPHEHEYRIRFRVDGLLREFTARPSEEYATTLNTIKVLADMNISERQLPQDGHIELVLTEVGDSGAAGSEQYFDVRVSVFPSVNGEVIVMRLLNRQSTLLSMEELGMDAGVLKSLREALLTSFGMLLVTGPTGSGKTTTLYSILRELRGEERNIVTLEDPIEFHLDWLRQCEIRPERGLTFERAMESVLRQDPDVLMVGEIRDPHTAEYAVRSALVGRIVGSTIHANTAIGTIARLLELDIPRSILAHSINAIIAQRLVRRTCDACKEPYMPQELHLTHFDIAPDAATFVRGRGCDRCGGSGYRGRIGIFSIMILDDTLRSLIFDQRSLTEIQDYAIAHGMQTIKMDAAAKVLAGVTTVEEAARVI